MSRSGEQNEGERFKYLGFFHEALIKTRDRLCSIYECAKQNSGPLKPGVDTVEGTVKIVVRPVYQKIEGKPLELLHFVDRKVDDTIIKLDNYVPPILKEGTYRIYGAARKAPEVARSVVSEVREVGVVEKAKDAAKNLYTKSEPRAKSLYNKYEPVAEEWSLLAWYKLRQFPVVPQLLQALIPPSSYCVEKYNYGVQYLVDEHYRVAAYLPLVPAEKIKRAVYKGLEMQEYRELEGTENKGRVGDAE